MSLDTENSASGCLTRAPEQIITTVRASDRAASSLEKGQEAKSETESGPETGITLRTHSYDLYHQQTPLPKFQHLPQGSYQEKPDTQYMSLWEMLHIQIRAHGKHSPQLATYWS